MHALHKAEYNMRMRDRNLSLLIGFTTMIARNLDDSISSLEPKSKVYISVHTELQIVCCVVFFLSLSERLIETARTAVFMKIETDL